MSGAVDFVVHDGHGFLVSDVLSLNESLRYFRVCRDRIAWQQESIRLFNRTVTVPRLVSFYGDPGVIYRYSGTAHQAIPWMKPLLELKSRAEFHADSRFNSALGNLYRDGNDSMGWHCDNEPELGSNPVIASLSLGSARRFQFRHKVSRQVINVELPAGSMLIMRDGIQSNWLHCVPKTRLAVSERINLTFRWIEQ